MKATSLRLHDTPPRLVGRDPGVYGPELQDFLERLDARISGGIPAGFNSIDPEQVEAGDVADPGVELDGWAAASHTHPVLTDIAVELKPVSTSAEGTSSGLARADHTHDMSKVMADVMSKVSLGF